MLSEGFLDTLPQMFCRFYCVGKTVRFDYVSRILLEWTGYMPETFIAEGRNWLEQILPSDRRLLRAAIENAAGREDGFVVEYRLLDGDRVRYVRHTARPDLIADGSLPIWNGCIEDTTPLRQAQQNLERSQLLQSMGWLVAGIAHEINTPIQFIGDNLHFLDEAWEALCAYLRALKQSTLSPPEAVESANTVNQNIDFLLTEAPDAIRQSLEGIERISGLVAAMRDFSRLDERRMAAADLNRAVRSTLTILRNELKYTADVCTELDTSLPEVHCSVDEISRVLLNLLINAGHSIKEKIDKGLFTRGRICVRTQQLDKQIEICVSDDGMGIPDAIRHRIFERFFTTKRDSQTQGTGQGLAMARSIIEEHHHGRLTFESKVECGTTFTIRIPLEESTERTPG
ncbi:MAG: PAS domain-containing protein [Phycisphaerae bacterium]|nr:PAS domain-containing protein [Phycisphaerae bacterium]